MGSRKMTVPALVGLILLAFLSIGAARASGTTLSEPQSEQLHQAICSIPVHKVKHRGLDIWACDQPRDYPAGAASGGCSLSFDTSDKDGLVRLYYGRFTANEPQALAIYTASCEPHSNNFGGMALFRAGQDGFRLVRYFRGQVYVDCAIPPSQGGALQTPYCFSSHMGQGELGQAFGPLRLTPDGQARLEVWLAAGNDDGDLTTMVSCDRSGPGIHHFIGVDLDRSKTVIVLEGASLDRRSFRSACDRYKKHDFNAEEQSFREMSAVAVSEAFIRPTENKYVKALIRFQPPSRNPKVEITSQSVPQE
jgi:hypothetical protein